jgi:hypothetical protein
MQWKREEQRMKHRSADILGLRKDENARILEQPRADKENKQEKIKENQTRYTSTIPQ